jgi:hypothetical protein
MLLIVTWSFAPGFHIVAPSALIKFVRVSGRLKLAQPFKGRLRIAA